MNQRWLWNFPEGPCSPCYSPSECQSLTSTAAAIGWRADRVEHYWSTVLCHTDHSVQASLFLSKSIFAAMQRSPPPPPLDVLYSFILACLFFTAVCTRGNVKKGLWEIISGVVIFHLCRNVFRLCCILKEAQAACSKTMWLYLTDIYNSTLWRLCYRLTQAWHMNSLNYTEVQVCFWF